MSRRVAASGPWAGWVRAGVAGKPSGRECELAYIGPGSEHVFTQDDGDTYTVRVDEIRKVEAKPGAKGAKASRAEVARVVAGDKLEDSRE